MALGLAMLCLTLLSACSQTKPVQVQTVVVTPPAVLLREIPLPAVELETNLDLLNYALQLAGIVEQHNSDKRALRVFFEEIE